MKEVTVTRTLTITKTVSIPDELHQSLVDDETGDVSAEDFLPRYAPTPDIGKEDWEIQDEDVEVDLGV